LSLAISAVAFGASTTKNLSTNFTLVNLGTASASVSIDYLKPNGDQWTGSGTTDVTLDPNGGQKTVYQYFDTIAPGQGSVVLSSNQPLGAVVQILARNQVATSGAYSGFSSGSPVFDLPLVIRRLNSATGLVNTQIMVQNTGSDAATVSITFNAATGSTPPTFTKSGVVIQGGATFYYDLESEAGLNPGWQGSAVVDAGTGQVAVVVNMFFGPNGLQTYNAFPSTSAGANWAVPLFMSRLVGGKLLSTPVAVQNVSGSTIPAGNIQLNCTGTDLSNPPFSKTSTTAVANNAAYYFNPVTDMSIPNNWQGSCVVAAGANVVVFVQMRKLDPSYSDQSAAYEAFNMAATDTQVFVPLVDKRLPNGFATATTFQNLTSSATVVKLTYTRNSSCTVGNPSYVFDNIAVPANGQIIENFRLAGTRPSIPDGWFGTLTLQHDAAHDGANPARAFVGFSQLTYITTLPGDTFMAHDAFTQP
jgi:hypothetical protein